MNLKTAQTRISPASVEMLNVPGLEVAWATHPGRVRGNNEDAVAVASLRNDTGVLVIVSDGMGGHAGGEVASQIVCDRLLKCVDRVEPERSLKQRYEAIEHALLDADRLVRETASVNLSLTGMGATALIAAITPRTVVHLYAGDSRLYHFRAGQRLYRTEDHSVVEVLRRTGRIQESEMRRHPQRNVLLSCIGGQEERPGVELAPRWKEDVAQQEAELTLEAGDVLLLCSDGLNGLVDEQALAAMVEPAQRREAANVVAQLVDAALEAGGTDNITVVLVKVSERT